MIVAVDFDGTIVEHKFPAIGPEAPGAKEWLWKWHEAGAKLILWTVRSDGLGDGRQVLTVALDWLKANGFPSFWGINNNPDQKGWTSSHKAYAHIYVDDAAFGCPVLPTDGRPVVDWSIVGPAVLTLLKAHES